MRRGRRLAPLLLVLLAGACVDEEAVAALEAERQELQDKTVAKELYWKEVGRKGQALRELRAVRPDLRELELRRAQAESLEQQLAPRIAEAEAINERIAGQLDQLRANLDQLAESLAELDEFVKREGVEDSSPAAGGPEPAGPQPSSPEPQAARAVQ
jgi:hypothetical protein